MRSRPEVVEKLAALAARGTISLLCSSRCEDPALCHRTLLKALVEDALKRRLAAQAAPPRRSGRVDVETR